MWHSVVCCITVHFSVWYRTCFEAGPFLCCHSEPHCERWPQRVLLLPSSLTVHHWPYDVNPIFLLIFFLKLFSSFDILLKMFSMFISSSVIKKLENTKIHKGGNNSDPDSEHSRVNDGSYFGLFILSLSLYLSWVLQYPKKCRFFPTNKLRTIGTTTK